MFTPVGMVHWVDVEGGCYRVVPMHGSTLGLDGWCVGHACMLVACVYLTLSFHVLLAFTWLLIMVVIMFMWRTWRRFCGMHCHDHMTSYIWLYVAYILLNVAWLHPCMVCFILVCFITCIILIGLLSSIIHSCSIIRFYACLLLVTHCLCMLMFACGQVYNDVMLVFMHEVMVCVFDMVMH